MGNRDRYVSALKNYMDSRDDELAIDFEKSLALLSILDQQSAWNGLADQWNQSFGYDFTHDQVKQRLSIIKELEERFNSFPRVGFIADEGQKAYLNQLRLEDVRSTEEDIREFFQDKIFDLYYVEQTKDRRRFYCVDEPKDRDSAYLAFKYLKNDDFESGLQQKTIKVGELQQFNTASGLKYYDDSPQKKFATDVSTLLQQNQRKSFEEKICMMMAALREDPYSMDPILRYQLLSQFFSTAEASLILTTAFAGYKESLSQIAGEEVDESATYLDPIDPNISKLRDRLKSQLRSFKFAPLKVFKDEIAQQLADFHELKSLPKFEWLGIAMQKNDGDWDFEVSPTIDENGRSGLVCVPVMNDSSAAGANQFSVINVGSFKAEKFKFDSDFDKSSLNHGHPLLLFYLDK